MDEDSDSDVGHSNPPRRRGATTDMPKIQRERMLKDLSKTWKQRPVNTDEQNESIAIMWHL